MMLHGGKLSLTARAVSMRKAVRVGTNWSGVGMAATTTARSKAFAARMKMCETLINPVMTGHIEKMVLNTPASIGRGITGMYIARFEDAATGMTAVPTTARH